LLGIADDQFQLTEFLDDGDDVLAHLAGQNGHLDELVMLEAVADDRRLAAVGQGEHREQLRLGPRFKTEAVGPAEIEDLFDDMALLIHLDRIDADVLALVAVLVDGILKRLGNFADAMTQNIGEAQQDRQLDAALLQLIDELFQVDGLLGAFVGMDRDMAFFVYAEIAFAPVLDLVDIHRVLDFPLVDEFHQESASRAGKGKSNVWFPDSPSPIEWRRGVSVRFPFYWDGIIISIVGVRRRQDFFADARAR